MSKDLKEYKVQKKYYRVEECYVMAKDWEDAENRAWDIVSEGIDWDYVDDTLDIEVEEIM